MTASAGLKRLLQPRHIAVFGGHEAGEVIRQCRRIGFAGELWPVHPSRTELAGLPCYRAVAGLPAAPDASFIAVPREATVEIIGALAARGAGGAVCYAAGFAELDAVGAGLQRQLVEAAGELAVVGPNCYGLLNYLDGAALWPDAHGGKRCRRGVAIITQSGNMGLNLTLQQRSLPLAYLITTGNAAGLRLPDYIDALLDDARISAIGLHIEGLRDIPAFAAAAARAQQRGIPLVALKTGRSDAGARVTLSHTSSLAGSDALYDALFERCGVARCDGLPEFLETLKLLHVTGPLPALSLASMSCSGGEAAIVADLAADLGLSLPPLTDAQRGELREVLGERVALDNPLDYHTYIWGDLDRQTACFSTVLRGGQALALLVLDYPPADAGDDASWQVTEQALVAARDATGAATAVVSSLPESFPETARERLLAQGIAPLQGLREALLALRAAARIGSARRHPPLPPVTAPPPGSYILDEWRSKQALAEHGLPLAPGELCSAEDAPRMAQRLGFPVVVKAVAESLAHKTEAGAVALNLTSVAQVAEAAKRLAALSPTLLVERMVTDAVAELLVGVTRDPQFGLVLVLGSGGVQAELLGDVQRLLLPTGRGDIVAALGRLKLAPLFTGYRGRPVADLEAAADALLAVLAYCQRIGDRLLELDVNPLLIRPAGSGAVAVDALIRLSSRENEMTDFGVQTDMAVLDQVLTDVAGLRVLDVGCGDGTLCDHLAGRRAEMVGVDPLPQTSPSGRELLTAPAEALPLPDASMDGVILKYSLHHVPMERMSQALNEACRVLKPGGFLYVAEPQPVGSAYEVMQSFHDEAAAQSAAQEALLPLAARFVDHQRHRYTTDVEYDDFAAFTARVLSVPYNQHRPEQVAADDVRQRFEACRRGERYVLDHLVLVDLFRGLKRATG